VKDDARALRKPFVDGGRLVRGGIVENDLKLSRGEFLFERFKKGQEVPSGVRFPTVGQDMAAGNLQSGVQVKDAVAAVVVGVPFDRPVEPPEMGEVISLTRLGGLHHRYSRRAD